MTATITRRQFGVGAAALGAAAATGLPLSAQAAMTLKYGNAGNINSISNQFAVKLFETVKARTNGEISTEVFAGTLGGEKTLVEGLALGTLDTCITAYTGTREFDIFYSPFFFRDGAHAGRVVNGPLRERAGKVLEEKYNAKFLGIGRLGRWCLFVQEPIDSLADIKGMKIRAPQIEDNIRSLEHLAPTRRRCRSTRSTPPCSRAWSTAW